MKKAPYWIIALVAISAIVFAGCPLLNFADHLPSADTPSSTATTTDPLTNFVLDGAINVPLVANGTVTVNNQPRSLGNLKASYSLFNGATISPDPRQALDYGRGKTFTVTLGRSVTNYTINFVAYNEVTNPYGVYSAKHLSDIRNGPGFAYKLMKDIYLPSPYGYDASSDPAGLDISDYNTAGWLPLPLLEGRTDLQETTAAFAGSFDGNNHIVKNLIIERVPTDIFAPNFVGLFSANTGTISKLGVKTGSGGMLARAGDGYGVGRLGGIAGANGGTISQCFFIGQLSGEYAWALDKTDPAGGGWTGGYNIGGIAGYNSGTIQNCYATGSIYKAYYEVGGLVGQNLGTITNSYAKMSLSILNSDAGLLVGKHVPGYSTITSAFYSVETMPATFDANKGAPKAASDFTNQRSFTGWDFKSIWQVGGEISPSLQNMPEQAFPD